MPHLTCTLSRDTDVGENDRLCVRDAAEGDEKVCGSGVVTGLAAAVRRMTSKAIADTGLDTEPGGATKPLKEMASLRGFEPLLPP
ncbi:MAG: hypothetical protein JWR00_832 [Rubritepida sp.]|nr:hypothetical protein [Rubritepida sp.]